jgi:nucleotide-binding universal stress UspA family protein
MQMTKERAAAKLVVHPSTYATILVHAEPGEVSSHRVEVAARLARTFEARLMGLGAETFDPLLFTGPATGYAAGEWISIVQEQVDKNLTAAETAFRRDAAGAEVTWRTAQDYPHYALVNTAHAADLIVASPGGERSTMQAADPADVVMSAGRPVLIVPEDGAHFVGKSVVVAWKNSRECRRALADALPFLQRAEDVVVAAIAKPDTVELADRETADVVANLKRHGVEARAVVKAVTHDAAEKELDAIARDSTADLIVAGAYGHSRMREWAFGGVTKSLLRQPGRFVLLSH